MPTSTQPSMVDGLNKMLSDIAQLMALPDADLEFLTTLQTGIVSYIRQGQQPASQPQSAVPGGAGGPNPGGPSMGGLGQMPPGMMGGGASMGMAMPNPDELRRMIQTTSGGQGG